MNVKAKKPQLTLRYLENLKQLRVYYLKRENEDDFDVNAERRYLEINDFSIVTSPKLEYNVDSLKIVSEQSFENLRYCGFTIEAELIAYLEPLNLPPIKGLPASNELMNDWVYCCHHDNEKHTHEVDRIKLAGDCLLNSEAQILHIIHRQSCNGHLLLESVQSGDTVIMKMINNNCIIGEASAISKGSNMIQLVRAIGVQFKILTAENNWKELKLVRSAFNYDWFKVERLAYEKFTSYLKDLCLKSPPDELSSDKNDFFSTIFLDPISFKSDLAS